MSSMSCKSKKPRKISQKKKEKIGGGSCPPGKCFFLGGGKCPNLGVVNVRILGVVNVLLANDSQSEVGPSPSNIVSVGGLQVVGFKGFLSKDPGVHY